MKKDCKRILKRTQNALFDKLANKTFLVGVLFWSACDFQVWSVFCFSSISLIQHVQKTVSTDQLGNGSWDVRLCKSNFYSLFKTLLWKFKFLNYNLLFRWVRSKFGTSTHRIMVNILKSTFKSKSIFLDRIIDFWRRTIEDYCQYEKKCAITYDELKMNFKRGNQLPAPLATVLEVLYK